MSGGLGGLTSLFSSANLVKTLGTITSAVSSIGEIYSGYAERRALKSQAEDVRLKAAYEEEKSRAKLKHLIGTQKLLYAKAGVDPSYGSALSFMAYTASEGERDIQIELYGAERKTGELERKGRQAQTEKTISGISSFLTGVEKAYIKEK